MSAVCLERARSSCALHGALATFHAIDGVVPVIHATAGCGVQYHRGVTPFGGAVPQGAGWGPPLSSSNIHEKHVVFGGGSRLREQLKNTVKVVRGDVYAIVTGCATEMVGDDVPAMAKEGREQGFPVIYANTPGFRGSVHAGYELAVRALLEQLPSLPGATPALRADQVNLWGIIPQQDVFWQGHLLQLESILAELGLVANKLLGEEQGVEAWRRVPHAALNLVVSPWGRQAAQWLREKHGTTVLEIPGIPVGPKATAQLLAQLTRTLDLDAELLAAVQQKQAAQYARTMQGVVTHYFAAGFQRDFAIVGDFNLVYGVTEFLAGTLGLYPKLAVITDPLPEEQRAEITAPLQQMLAPLAGTVAYLEDGGAITEQLTSTPVELIIGSALEREAAAALDVPLVQLHFPVADRLILHRGYAGLDGGFALVEDLGSALVAKQGWSGI